MKKKTLLLMISMALVLAAGGCGNDVETSTDTETLGEKVPGESQQEVEEIVRDEVPEGYYRSELTNEIISEDIKDQRPVAIMVDNEKIALPHYGLTDADVIYELMNSTANGRITRFMCLYKDWDAIERVGSIRSVRPTNILLATEWNAVLVHDGGPFYINEYLKDPAAANFSGGFKRINNGKAREYTEYVTTGEIAGRFEKSKYSTTYNEYYEGSHFRFASEAEPVTLDNSDQVRNADFIDLPFRHNGSELKYSEEDGLYYYSEYGSPHLDAGNDNKQLSFKNVIIQYCSFHQYDSNGYMIFNCIGQGLPGYYITNGNAIPIYWDKLSSTGITRYYDLSGNEITLNTGKTYIAFVPDDNWNDLVIE
ncbi:MAG: DUF3048 domain-containing protein [Lachnospiraceae bacterium]